jgi:hypothetical protein
VWKGKVNSDGTPTELITLKMHERYQIKASQFINLGKWVQGGEKLANDACYEYNPKLPPHHSESLKNSQNIQICDNTYHEDHVYKSEFFEAKQNRIFFWISDIDYDDNNGSLDVEIIHKSNK